MENTKFLMELAIDKNNLDALVHLIIDNADLNYSGEDLRIANAETVLQFIKYIYPKTYKEKLEEFKNQIEKIAIENKIDEIIPITNEDAIDMTVKLPKIEGILSGISGAANICAAIQLSKREDNKGKIIVTIVPDCGDHYLSCGIFKEE